MHIIALVVLSVLIAGCATGERTEDVMRTWIGAPVVGLIEAWGPPSRVIEAGDRKFYTWDSGGRVQLPATTTHQATVIGSSVYGTSTTTGGQVLDLWCSQTFAVDAEGIIRSWRWEGNNCP